MTARAYLDWNATAPLRPEARAAMLNAMDAVGNPSSVHSEGRAARAIIETARAQIAEAFGAADAEIVFTSGATEATALALHNRNLSGADVEHDCVRAWATQELDVSDDGAVTVEDPANSTLQLANSETGRVQTLPEGLMFTDAVQAFGKIPFAFAWSGAKMAALSAHKIGGPKGAGALVMQRGQETAPLAKGGGHEMGRRAGTENVISIAGFGAAAQAAQKDLANGLWEEVAQNRDWLETAIADAAPDTIFFAKGADRLPNTSCFAKPGWKGETQVMQMDLRGFAVSAGSACSSGKVKASAVLTAMGHVTGTASSAIRVSIGPSTTRAELERFTAAWADAHQRHQARRKV